MMNRFFYKASEMMGPDRFLSPAWKERIIELHDSFVHEKALVVEAEGEPTAMERVAIRRSLSGDGEEIRISIKGSHSAANSGWIVQAYRGQQPLLVLHGCSPSQAIEHYRKLLRTLIRSTGRSENWPKWFIRLAAVTMLMVSAFAFFAILGGIAQSSNSAFRPHPAAAEYGFLTPPIQQSPAAGQTSAGAWTANQPSAAGSPSNDPITAQERKLIEKAARIAMGPSGAPTLVVFSDPKCPFCQKLESSIEQVVREGKLRIEIIPVAYKEGSRDLVASVLCAKDQKSAWSQVMSNGKALGQVCQDGLRKVDENNRLFADLRLSATPTIISPGGLVAATYATSQELEVFSRY